VNANPSTDLDARVARLEAHEAIRALVADYSFHMDHADFGAVAALFTDGCSVDFGIAPPLEGRARLEQFLAAAAQPADPAARMLATSHHNADLRIELGDEAHARGTVSLYAWHAPAAGGRAEVWGYYFDDYERTPAGWRIATRLLRVCGEDAFPAPWTPSEREEPS
jgi:ketosteroid isomerase-like protein